MPKKTSTPFQNDVVMMTCVSESSQVVCLLAVLQGTGQQGTPGRSDGESGKICQHQLTPQTVVSQSIGSFYPKLNLRGRMPLALLEKRQVDPFPMPEKQTHTEATMTVVSLQGVNQT